MKIKGSRNRRIYCCHDKAELFELAALGGHANSAEKAALSCRCVPGIRLVPSDFIAFGHGTGQIARHLDMHRRG